MRIFGPLQAFENRYVRRERTRPRRGDKGSTNKIVGYRNTKELRARVKPFILRRRVDDPEVEVELPDIMPPINVWLNLGRRQRQHYNDARRGVVEMFKEGDVVRARSHFHHLQYACDTTAAFGDPDPESVKIDWLINHLRTELRGMKVVIFSRYHIALQEIGRALRENNIRYVEVSGRLEAEEKTGNIEAFVNNPRIDVLVGSSTIERGLNLQVASYLINFDQLWNPQRQQQLLGRIRRIGSEHATVHVINLMTEDTIEQKLQRRLMERAAVSDYVLEETSELWEELSDAELLTLIQE